MKLDPRSNDFAQNVYRDLRDRRLLPVVALLIVGIIAVPLLVKGGDSASAPSAPVAEAAPFDGAAELRPVVIGADPGLRNYHERLDGSPSRNPFKQQLVPKAKTGGDGSGSTGSGTGLQTQETATEPDTSTTTEPTDSSSSGSSDDSSGNGDGHGHGHGPPKNDTVLEASIDVKVGPAGSTKIVDGVRTLTLLPSKGHPIVQYTGSDNAGTRASFVVSGDVVSTEGDGDCKPTPDDCRFLNMRIGQQKKLTTGSGKTYVLKLLDVHIERVDAKDATAAGLSAALQGSSPG